MNDAINAQAAAIATSKIAGEVVTQTLDKINKPTYSAKNRGDSAQAAMNNTYSFSKDILSSAYEAKGAAINTNS